MAETTNKRRSRDSCRERRERWRHEQRWVGYTVIALGEIRRSSTMLYSHSFLVCLNEAAINFLENVFKKQLWNVPRRNADHIDDLSTIPRHMFIKNLSKFTFDFLVSTVVRPSVHLVCTSDTNMAKLSLANEHNAIHWLRLFFSTICKNTHDWSDLWFNLFSTLCWV
jgi:hypothetical protein